MTVIGIEEHWTYAPLDDGLQRRDPVDDSLELNEHGDAAQRLRNVGAERIAAMDEQGIDLQVLSLAPPGAQGLAPSEAIALSRAANDAAAETVAAHPTRFRAFAALPLAHPAAAATELDRAGDLGLVGAMLYGRTGDVALDDPGNDAVWSVAEERGLTIFIHPQIPPRQIRSIAYSGLGRDADLALATYAWGWHLEAGTAALRLMADGVLDRYPRLQIILGHWGELLLFWHQRAEGLARAARLQRTIGEYLRQNVWVTSSGMLDPAMLQHALSIIPIDRMLFSTDYPFQRPERSDIGEFLSALPDDSRAAFSSGNARGLFGITGQVGAIEER